MLLVALLILLWSHCHAIALASVSIALMKSALCVNESKAAVILWYTSQQFMLWEISVIFLCLQKFEHAQSVLVNLWPTCWSALCVSRETLSLCFVYNVWVVCKLNPLYTGSVAVRTCWAESVGCELEFGPWVLEVLSSLAEVPQFLRGILSHLLVTRRTQESLVPGG